MILCISLYTYSQTFSNVFDLTQAATHLEMLDRELSQIYCDKVYASVCRDSFYEAKMQEQLQELEQLRDERHKLLAIQQELQSLHDRFSVVRSPLGQSCHGRNKSI